MRPDRHIQMTTTMPTPNREAAPAEYRPVAIHIGSG